MQLSRRAYGPGTPIVGLRVSDHVPWTLGFSVGGLILLRWDFTRKPNDPVRSLNHDEDNKSFVFFQVLFILVELATFDFSLCE